MYEKCCILNLKLIIMLKQSAWVVKTEANGSLLDFQVDDSEKKSTNTSPSEAGGHVNPVR